ncbi:hypothetical protein AVEN_53540-1 [Araneus ventricosus]|uniref:Uncharacterized protein n=1 Tax=Araneus ventricosus TaxID=182803 RepID=A0A4Y2PVB0_ARAVE|nr:hypothetical protein AVEN_53540-1 [Araneus ventricosus]
MLLRNELLIENTKTCECFEILHSYIPEVELLPPCRGIRGNPNDSFVNINRNWEWKLIITTGVGTTSLTGEEIHGYKNVTVFEAASKNFYSVNFKVTSFHKEDALASLCGD